MTEVAKRVNEVFAQWDPLGVGKDIALDEYIGYVPKIIKSANSERNLIEHLEGLLSHLGSGYDPKNENHKRDLYEICGMIIQIVQNSI